MTLFAMSAKPRGFGLAFQLDDEDESIVEATRNSEMLFDASGRSWPACSLLVAPFAATGRKPRMSEVDDVARKYLGRTYSIKAGKVKLPPKALSSWRLVGGVKDVFYFRRGRRAPGPFHHEIGGKHLANWYGLLTLLRGDSKEAFLYEHGDYMRVELGKNCVVDDRGIVAP